jgi:hypothetical protein
MLTWGSHSVRRASDLSNHDNRPWREAIRRYLHCPLRFSFALHDHFIPHALLHQRSTTVYLHGILHLSAVNTP